MTAQDNNKRRARDEAAALADKYISKEGGPPKPDAVREELASLERIEYGQRREELSAVLGIPRGLLDAEYEAQRRAVTAAAAAAEPKGPLGRKEPEPWEEEIDGDALLDEIVVALNRHLVTQDGAADVAALWAVFAHALDCFHIAPLLAVTSPTVECGKSTLLTLIGELVPRALPASNITSAALFRAMDKWHPSLLVDEADTFLKDDDELRGVINSGHRKGSPVIRTTGDNHDPVPFDTWGAKCIALVGKLQRSLASRSIHIEMKRKKNSDKVAEVRLDRLGHLLPIKRRMMRWVKDNESALRDADPTMPEGVHGRAADNWRPLLAIADQAGAGWPVRAREIAIKLSGRLEDDSFGPALLADMPAVFAETDATRLGSETICEMLGKVEERPWGEFSGVGKDKPITPTKLAALLKPFGVKPGTVKLKSGKTTKGYKIEDLRDAISRYVPSPSGASENAVTAVTPSPTLKTKGFFVNEAVTSPVTVTSEGTSEVTAEKAVTSEVTAERAKKSNKINGGDGVTAVTPIPGGNGRKHMPKTTWQRPTIGEEAPTTSSGPSEEDLDAIPAHLERRTARLASAGRRREP